MFQTRWLTTLLLAALLISGLETLGQRRPQDPHIGYIYPAGGQQGTVFEVSVGGQSLNRVTEVVISGEGVQATAGKYSKPLTPKELSGLRTKLQKVRKRLETESQNAQMRRRAGDQARFADLAREMGISDEELEKLAAFRKSRTDPMYQINPQIAESVALQVRLSPTAPPGRREVRLRTATGLSNPVAFYVGNLREHRESEPNGEVPNDRIEKMPITVNGQIMPGDIDRFYFPAHKNMRLVVAASARELIPYLADAVPGWFQAVVALYDSSGNEVAYADDFLLRPDPVLFCTIPENGQYILEVRDAIYRGRQDFVYRITLGEIPYVKGIFPIGGREGTQTSLNLRGWNLPVKKLTVDVAGDTQVRWSNDGVTSNQVPFAVDSLPEQLENEPNDGRDTAQLVSPPVIVNGHINKPGDVEMFRFEGRAGAIIVAEVYARRLHSPMDSVLSLVDTEGQRLIFNDDYEDKGSGLITHHADSKLLFTLPATGTYYLTLGDSQQKGGRDYAYRVRISPPRPDFELRVLPSSVSARAGMTVPIKVCAMRRDGFSEEISLALKDAPRGFTLSGGWIPADQDEVRLTLTVPATGSSKPFALQMEGSTVIQGKKVSRPAIPADEMIQAFAYHHLVPAEDWLVAVNGNRRTPTRLLKLLAEEPVRLSPGRTSEVRFSLPRARVVEQIQLTLNEPPDGIRIQTVEPIREGMAIRFHVDAENTEPGLKGNLIVDVFMERTVPPKEGKPQVEKRRVSLGTLPAIPFEIVGL